MQRIEALFWHLMREIENDPEYKYVYKNYEDDFMETVIWEERKEKGELEEYKQKEEEKRQQKQDQWRKAIAEGKPYEEWGETFPRDN